MTQWLTDTWRAVRTMRDGAIGGAVVVAVIQNFIAMQHQAEVLLAGCIIGSFLGFLSTIRRS